MSRVNLDTKVWNDPRVKRLNALLKWRMPWTVGALAAVWNVAYEAKDPHVTADDIDTAAECDGFAEWMQHPKVALAHERGGVLYLSGVAERIEYLLKQAERGARGGAVRTANAQRDPSGRLASAKQTPSKRLANAEHSPALPLDHDLDPAPDLDLALAPAPQRSESSAKPTSPKVRKPKTPEYTPEELASTSLILSKLSGFNGINYRGAKEHTALITRHLRNGLTEWDLRRVIGYCAIECKWAEKPNMRIYLRPETLFGPENISKYLDAARSWEPSLYPPEQRPPPLRLVTEPVPDTNVIGADNESTHFDDERWEEPSWMTSNDTTGT